MKTKLLILSFISVFSISQVSFINSKNASFFTKATENPYAPYSDDATTYSGKTMDIVEENNRSYATPPTGDIRTVGYIQIIDNSTNDFFNFITNVNGVFGNYYVNIDNGSHPSSRLWFVPSLSNIARNNTYYSITSAGQTAVNLHGYLCSNKFALYNPENPLEADEILWEEFNNEDVYNKTPFNDMYIPTGAYPYINPYSSENNDVFQINNVSSDGELTFTIKVNNWTENTDINYLTEENKIGVTLVNEEESDDYLQYEQFEAYLVSSNGDYYTYKIEGLTPDANYNFYSINYTGLTIGDTAYLADYDITLNSNLGVPKSYTTIYQEPYIDPSLTDVFKIDQVGAKSIEFSLKIIDSYDNYLNYLKTVDNTIDVSLLKEGSTEQIQTEAIFESESNGVFTFKITGLDNKTNYEIVSLNNTGLMINGEVKPIIYINVDLGITDTHFTTGSNLIFYLVIGISILLILAAIILFLYYFFKKRSRGTKIKDKMSSSF